MSRISETWVPVPIERFSDRYEVSSLGRIRKSAASRCASVGQVLTKKLDPNGYIHIDLCRDNQKERWLLHRLVALAFIGKPLPGQIHVNHKDGNKSNNDWRNLEWCTVAENIQHAFDAGLRVGKSCPGESNSRAKLTWSQVNEIRQLKGQMGQRRIASQFGVSRSTIQWIHQGKHWVCDPSEWPEDLRVREIPEVAHA